MAKDYKGSGNRRRGSSGGRKGGTRASQRSGARNARRTRRRSASAPGWQWMLAGLTLGLFVGALVIVLFLRPPIGRTATTQPAAPAPAPATPARSTPASPAASSEPRYDFYEVLPRYEVVITEEEAGVDDTDTARTAVREPGNYVLQAGSFRRHADADRRQATLALQGIESRIQVVTVDDQAWHRVRIGPLSDLEQLDRLRDRLRTAGVEFVVIRVGGN